MSDKYLDLSKGEVDVALRSGDTDDGELVGRKIGDSLWAVYASPQVHRSARAGRTASRTWRSTTGSGLDESMATTAPP